MSEDITFCPISDCDMKCFRNKKRIQNRAEPHSYSVDIPEDCPRLSRLFVEGYRHGYEDCKAEYAIELETMQEILSYLVKKSEKRLKG